MGIVFLLYQEYDAHFCYNLECKFLFPLNTRIEVNFLFKTLSNV